MVNTSTHGLYSHDGAVTTWNTSKPRLVKRDTKSSGEGKK